MNYYSQRHYERVQKNHKLNDAWFHNIWFWAAILLGLMFMLLIWSDVHKVQTIQKATCQEAYIQGETGVYCQ